MKPVYPVLLLLLAFIVSCSQEKKSVLNDKILNLCSSQIDDKRISIGNEWRLLMAKKSFPYFKQLKFLKIEAQDKRQTEWKVFHTLTDISSDSTAIIFTERKWYWNGLARMINIDIGGGEKIIPVPYSIKHSFLPQIPACYGGGTGNRVFFSEEKFVLTGFKNQTSIDTLVSLLKELKKMDGI